MKVSEKIEWIYVSIAALIFFLVALFWMSFETYWGESSLFIAHAWYLGGANPPGYPLFMTVLWPFQHIPVGDISCRTNITNGFFFSILGVLMYMQINMFIKKRLISFAGVVLFLLFQPILAGISGVEVYSLNLIFVICIIYFIGKCQNHSRYQYTLFFILGLSLAHHITTYLFFPIILLLLISIKKHIRELILLFIFVILGWSVNMHLIFRENVRPLYVWGDPDHIGGFIRLITASEEAKASFQSGLSSASLIWNRFIQLMLPLWTHIGLLGIILILVGSIHFFKNNSLFRELSAILLMFSIAVSVYNSNESKSFFLPGYLIIYMFLIYGLAFIKETTQKFTNRPSLYVFIGMLIGGILFIQPVRMYFHSRCFRNQVPRLVAKEMIMSVGEDEIIMTRRSDIAFLLAYLIKIERWSKATPIFQHLLSFKWFYRDLIKLNCRINNKLLNMVFEDSWEWNRAVAASVIKYNINHGKCVTVLDPEIIHDAKLAGLTGYVFYPSGFIAQVCPEECVIQSKKIMCFREPQYMDPLSRNLLSKQFYISALLYFEGNDERSYDFFLKKAKALLR